MHVTTNGTSFKTYKPEVDVILSSQIKMCFVHMFWTPVVLGIPEFGVEDVPQVLTVPCADMALAFEDDRRFKDNCELLWICNLTWRTYGFLSPFPFDRVSLSTYQKSLNCHRSKVRETWFRDFMPDFARIAAQVGNIEIGPTQTSSGPSPFPRQLLQVHWKRNSFLDGALPFFQRLKV